MQLVIKVFKPILVGTIRKIIYKYNCLKFTNKNKNNFIDPQREIHCVL